MPYVVLQALDVERAKAAASALAAAIAASLDLAPSDVIVSVTTSAGVFDGTGRLGGWPSAIIHGARRDSDAMANALAAIRLLLARALDVPTDHVWAHWCVSADG